MELVHCNLNIENSSREEILKEIDRLEAIRNEKANEEQGIKIFINSIYGASASAYFIGFNLRVAESITLQGQDLIFFATKILNTYFQNKWHKDTKLHKALGITTKVEKVLSEVVVYGDTDSTYLSFHDVMKSCDWPLGDGKNFVLGLYKHRLKDYIEQCFNLYAKRSGTDNIQKLELEKIAWSGIVLAKKKYVLDLAWKDPGISYDHLAKISPTGVELVQSSTPKFCRTHLMDLLEILFREKQDLNLVKFTEKLRELKDQFKLSDVTEISKNTSISDYNKYIIQDKDKLSIAKKCPAHVRAAGIYNYKINNNQKLKRKYPLIKSGDKVSWYYAKAPFNEKEFDVFAYTPAHHPYEMAPEVDYDRQFSKVVIEPINRFVQTMKFGAIPPNLITSKRLF